VIIIGHPGSRPGSRATRVPVEHSRAVGVRSAWRRSCVDLASTWCRPGVDLVSIDPNARSAPAV